MTCKTPSQDWSSLGAARHRETGQTPSGNRAIRANVEQLTDGRTLQVALTGTSNSVLARGFSAGIETHPNVGRLLNKSVGASGSVAIAAHMHDLSLGGFQYLFVDYCVNEAYFVDNGYEEIENVYRHMASLIDFAVRQGCLPVLVNLPTLHAVGQDMPVPAMLQQEFTARGVPMFDAQPLIESFAQRRGYRLEDAFQDEDHLKRPLAHEIGLCAVNLIERSRQAGAIDAVAQQTDARFGGIGYIPAEALVSHRSAMIERSNKRFQCRFLQIAKGETIIVPPPAPGRRHVLRGVAYNASRSLGRLVTEEGDLVLDIGRSHYLGLDRDMVLINLPSRFPDRPVSGEVRLVCQGGAQKDRDDIGFEVAGIILHDPDGDHPLHVFVVSEEYRNLTDRIDATDLENLDAAWQRAQLNE